MESVVQDGFVRDQCDRLMLPLGGSDVLDGDAADLIFARTRETVIT
jgi:hypothetical protein